MAMWTEGLAGSVDSMVLSDGARSLLLRKGEASATWTVRRFARTPRPSEVDPRAPAELFWLPSATPALRTRLRELGISWVTDLGEIHILAPWGTVHGTSSAEREDSASETERVALSPGAAVVLQFLLEHPHPAPQTRIAAAVGLSQPRVSQVMPELHEMGLVGRRARGYLATDPAEGFEILCRLRAPASIVLSWYSVEPPRAQLVAFRERAAAAHVDVRLCGDWAADLLAPWRQPGRIVVHADTTVDLDAVAFVMSPPETATLELRVMPIRAGWQPSPEVVAALTDQALDWPVAPVTEIAREIAAAGGSDADQAVGELKHAWLHARTAVARGGE